MENKKFIVAIYVPNSLVKTLGGAFTYVEVLTDFLLNVNNDELCFKLVTEGNKNESQNDEIVIDYDEIHYTFKQRLIFKLPFLINLLQKNKSVQEIKDDKKSNYIINTLKESNVDIIYYPNQHTALTDEIPFVINNWDLAHITVPPLPDTLHDINVREKWYKEIAVKAIAIFAESDKGKSEIQTYLNIHENRIKVLPIFPGRVIDLKVATEEQSKILGNFNLTSENYFFYPAQFWALKNHYHLLEAISLLELKKKNDFKVVFCGSDKQNMNYVKQLVLDFNLQDRIVFLGFVSNEELYTLYKNCTALVFPSLLGPTNMPILEAMELGVPILCSNLEGHKEMLPNFDGMFNPLNSGEISVKLQSFIDDPDFKTKILEQLMKIKKSTKFNRENSFSLLLSYFIEIKNFRKLWR